jgi:hypothetical protein
MKALLAVVGHEGAAVIVAQHDAAGGAGGERAGDALDRHAGGLDGGEAVAALGHVPAERLGVPVLDHGEQPHPAVLDGRDLGRVRAPHDVRRIRGDAAVVRLGRPRPLAMRRQQGVLAHEAQHALPGDAEAVEHAQPGPHLAVTLIGPGGTRQVGPDGGEQRLIRDHRLGAAAAAGDGRARLAP